MLHFTSVFLKHISLHYSWIWYTVNKKNKYEGQYEKYNGVVEYDKFYDINEIQREDFTRPFFTGHGAYSFNAQLDPIMK